MKRDVAASTLEKVKVDRATAQKALAAQCEETKKLRAELATARKGGVTFFGEEDGDKYRCAECGHTWNAIDDTEREHNECPLCGSVSPTTHEPQINLEGYREAGSSLDGENGWDSRLARE